MFTTKGLFSEIVCPYKDTCMLPRCIFKHSDTKLGGAAGVELQDNLTASSDQEGNRKRRKLDPESRRAENNGPPRDTLPATQASLGKVSSKPMVPKSPLAETTNKKSFTATREISPPPLKRKAENGISSTSKQPSTQSTTSTTKPKNNAPLKEEALNPRLLKIPTPASHDMRFRLLRALHEQFVRLNSELEKDAKKDEEELVLSAQALITKALDLEEEAAASASIYSNLVKNKILVYKRMSVKQWVEERAKEVAATKACEAASTSNTPAAKPTGPPKPIETGLTPEQELMLLPRLYTPINGLSKHGYVTNIPTTAEIETAKAGVEAAKGWEVCDRCKSRFQVFPERREEDGALASGGKCLYHYGKPYLEEKSSTDPKAKRARRYRCCNEALGDSAGCTTAENHVFKISEVKRMASVLNFEMTPENPAKEAGKPVCIDGEMGYTVYGLELIRLTATSWPNGEELFDVLVRPVGLILDLNSRYSGVWPKDMAEAPTWSTNTLKPSKGDGDSKRKLQIVDSPAKARSLLFSFLSPKTPLIGHGLENDLNATRMIHPTIIDTALLFPHKAGLPYRNGLKNLMATHLNRHIQVIIDGKMDGHDSKEDANAAGDLVRFAVANEWKAMLKDGWKLEGGRFMHKNGKELVPGGASKADLLKGLVRDGGEGEGVGEERGKKRTREEMEEQEKRSREKYGGLNY